jgi:hypothetical protein
MPACPDGSQIKPEIPEPLTWILPEAACAAAGLIPGWGPWLATTCAFMGPRLFNMADLCDSPPPEYPEINPVLLAQQGLLDTWQQNLSDWVWAAWVNANWSVWCQCVPTSGSGPCPPVDYTAPPLTVGLASGSTFAGSTTVPHGASTIVVTYSLVTATNPDNFYVRLYFKNAAGVDVAPEQNGNQVPVKLGTNQVITWTNLFTQQDRNDMRTVEIWARPTGQGSQTGSTMWTIEPRIQIAFTGTCQDLIVQPPPPDPVDPPDPPDAPPPPPLPASCTIDTVCQMVYVMLQELTRQGTLITLLQRYTLPFGFIPGTLHSGLTGSGSIPVNGLVGIRLDITSPLPSRQLEGNPPYLWDQGWLSIMTPDGMIDERRLTRDLQIWTPRMIQEATTVGYYLHPGVTANLMELWPQPY